MPQTSRGYPYPTLSDAPQIPAHLEALARAVDTDVTGVEQRIAAARPVQAESTDAIVLSNSWAALTPVVGVTFTAPPSGSVIITVGGAASASANGNSAELGYEVRAGATIGSGTVVLAADPTRAVSGARAVNTGAAATIGGSHRRMLTGLTAGASYNARVMARVFSAGAGATTARAILVEPVL